tara:strand:- start:854 stop:1960 length:1107 start_codon:yes stop_codon:yes gene_type:complete
MSEYAVLNRVDSKKSQGKMFIAIVMDHPTNDEVRLNKILAGGLGNILKSMCNMASIKPEDCLLTHVFQLKPAQDNVANFFHNKLSYKKLGKENKWRSPFPPTGHGFLKQEMEQDVRRLYKELNEVKPNVIIAMGSASLWALTGLDKIGSYRGTVMKCSDGLLEQNCKVVPTYSPSAVMRKFDFRPIVVADLKKAKQESLTSEIKRDERSLYLEPSLQDLYDFEDKFITENNAHEPLSFDIETQRKTNGEIKCIGFAPNKSHSLVLPFVKENGEYYWKYGDELKAWQWVKKILENPKITKVAQNQTFDISWLAFVKNIKVSGVTHDTMHAHHAFQPEMEKSLKFLGSVYTNEFAWKTLAKTMHSTKTGD